MNTLPYSLDGRPSRRFFLKAAATAAAAALSAPWVRALDGKIAPNSRLSIGCIGTGNMCRWHAEHAATNPRTQLLALCDVNRPRLELFAAKVRDSYGATCDLHAEHEEVLARPDIDAVMICTPDHWHAAIAIAAMRAGKDVYVEKPVSLTIEEGLALVAAQRRYGRVLQVGSQQRSDRAFRKAAEIVRNGWIGKVREVYVRLGEYRYLPPAPIEPVPSGFDYERWLGPAPWSAYDAVRTKAWRGFWDYGTRTIGDWGAHHFDIVQWALGRDHTGPVRFVPRGKDGEPHACFYYADGIKVVRNHPDMKGHMIRFIGEEGEVLVSRENRLVTTPSWLATRALGPGETALEVSNHHTRNWLECVETRARPIASVEVGHRTATICHLAVIAERLGRTVNWDPHTQTIVGDPEAARMVGRPRRAGYELPV